MVIILIPGVKIIFRQTLSDSINLITKCINMNDYHMSSLINNDSTIDIKNFNNFLVKYNKKSYNNIVRFIVSFCNPHNNLWKWKIMCPDNEPFL